MTRHTTRKKCAFNWIGSCGRLDAARSEVVEQWRPYVSDASSTSPTFLVARSSAAPDPVQDASGRFQCSWLARILVQSSSNLCIPMSLLSLNWPWAGACFLTGSDMDRSSILPSMVSKKRRYVDSR